MGVDLTRALSFGVQAENYDRLRPGYPPAAVDALVRLPRLRVADVGAGTGKLTAALLARGAQVTAVEPDAGMLAVLARRVGEPLVRAGVAERLPLVDSSVDLVVFGRSWHWAEPGPAAAEARRVLADGGSLAMLWNHSDDRVDWIRDLQRAEDPNGDPAEPEHLPRLDGFEPGEERFFDWTEARAIDEYLDLVQTHSSIAILDEPDRDVRLASIRTVLESQQPTPDGCLAIPQRCAVWTYQVR